MNLIYIPLYGLGSIVLLGATIYYFHRYEIANSNNLNKYKLSSNNILIKLKLFKYDNNFNYFLLIPYLIAWNLFLAGFILYIIYWCGVIELEKIFVNKWFNISLMGLGFLYIGYGAIIQQKILYGNGLEYPDFTVEEKKDKKD